ncbi:hypothetical protein [Streptomyces sp. NPDC094049]|uniref:hypothetical protein n=1 Tax=Streptomyces sp. NPDC094049 TaxID=3154987 RepID=UPI00331FBF78
MNSKRRQCGLPAEGQGHAESRDHDGLVGVRVEGGGWVYARNVRPYAAERLLAQRCEYHDTPEATDVALPDWETYDPRRHPGHLLGFPQQPAVSVLTDQAVCFQAISAGDAPPWAVPAALPCDPALFAHAVRDTRLSRYARGVLAELAAGHLPGHTPTLAELTENAEDNGEGPAFATAVDELVTHGYLPADAHQHEPGGSQIDLAPARHSASTTRSPEAMVPAAFTHYRTRVQSDIAFLTTQASQNRRRNRAGDRSGARLMGPSLGSEERCPLCLRAVSGRSYTRRMALMYSSGSGDGLPENARPDSYLAGIDPVPTEWVTVLQEPMDGRIFGIGSYLTTFVGREHALSESDWTHGSVGRAGLSHLGDGDDAVFHEGLADTSKRAEFFAQVRRHQKPGVEPTIEFTHSFLWYFAAIPRPDGSWYFLDEAGRDQELVRIHRDDADLRVEIAALPLRRYLAVRERLLVVQYERITYLDATPAPRIKAASRTKVSTFDFHSGHPGMNAFVRLCGKHLILPIDASPADLGYPYTTDESYPAFTIGTDPGTGQPIAFTCDPDRLGGVDAPGYLTRVYFRREVMRRYTSEPSRYQVGNGRLSCLGLWGISIGRNDEDLVETYLGDLGRDLPSAERAHWLSFNVAPRGGIDQERRRRDILGLWTEGPPDPLHRLAHARERFSTALSAVVGQPVYRAWDAADRIAFTGLHTPTSSEQSEADTQILTLAKGVIEYLSTEALRQLPGADAKSATINCLDGWVKRTNGDPDNLVGPLRLLQGLRSNGAAHARTRNWSAILTRAGLDKLQPDEQFLRLLSSTADALEALAAHAEAQTPGEGDHAPE